MTDRRSFDPFAPPPTAPDNPSQTGPDGAQSVAADTPTADEPAGDAVTAAGLIPDDLDDITKPELIELADMAGVATYGTKDQIAARIRDAAGQ